jgi:sugar/nucleoside kinase (ribokinase family)
MANPATPRSIDMIAAGHLCVDINPKFPAGETRPVDKVLRPGSLVVVEPAIVSTGGAATNVGLSARRMGLRVALMGKCGDDHLGATLLAVLRQVSPEVAGGLKVTPGEHTSYTIVLAVPGADRMFLHCPGANDRFSADDVDLELVARSRLFYFGYPPLMARMYAGAGEGLAEVLARVKSRGITTALDMALPDPHGAAGKADWPAILKNALPRVDVFAPSVEELTFMIRRDEYDRVVASGGDILDHLSVELLRDLSGRCLAWGSAVVIIKCGRHGLYVRSGPPERIGQMGSAGPDPDHWAGAEFFAPSYKVPQVVSASGAGDSAVAGFLGGLLRHADIRMAADYACAAGANNVQVLDTTSGIKSWTETTAQLKNPRVAPVVKV